ncbi:hypothetical protein COCMIDRAFT_5503 [Bipolaris oryzae ATCC 44560]|uniref:UBA domain-containing protein n=1 Tax=Bipolaris oryzae ATCC 44560 TaxID=930090 RepID=W6Z0M4_COCMI|nr:uncharacterized protein COCMIDRAFT_5503 [Bipolaris oryzae ATCC 44560]EUC45302.1 hypothetical protein COCMIDRAFT_5503 [Bipolaris oryzae ATCC 44560]
MVPKAPPLPFKPVSAGKANFVAQRAAIRQNVEIFKTRKDHHRRIFKYLVAELYARSERQGEDDITEEQHDIVERLRNNAGDFNLLYGGDSDFENGSDQIIDPDDEAYLISQRDEIIKQVLEQLDQPVIMRDDVEGSSSPDSIILEKASTLDPTESFAAQYTKDEISIIHSLADLTGKSYYRAEQCLSAAHWDLELALKYLDEDQPISSAGGFIRDQSGALTTSIHDRPVKHVPAGSSDGAKRRALGPQESINLIAALWIKLQHAKEARRTEEFERDGIKIRVEEVAGESDSDSPPIEIVYTAPANKPDPPKKRKPQSRKGLSHAGQPLWLDEAGTVTSRTGLQGTPYQQYLQMRYCLQLQYYGYEAIPSDDPHRGIPTKERCPPPLVQEASSDDEDDASVPEQEISGAELQAIIDVKVSGTGDEVDSVVGDEVDSVVSDGVDSVFGDDLEGDTRVNSPVSDNAGDNEPTITPALRGPEQPRKLYMKVRFNLGGGVEVAPGEVSDGGGSIEQCKETKQAEQKGQVEKRKQVQKGWQVEEVRGFLLGRLEEAEQVEEEEEEMGRRGMGLEREREAEEVEKRRRLFVSDEEDAWDGMFSDEELELDDEEEGDEAEEEEEGKGQDVEEKESKEVGEKKEDQGRVDELMDD